MSADAYSFLLALQEPTFIDLEIRYEGEPHASRIERIPIKEGEILIIPGDQLHGGSCYNVYNVRWHWYSIDPGTDMVQQFIYPDEDDVQNRS